LHHVRAREWKGDLVLLHELAEGPADRSLWPRRGASGRRAACGAGARKIGPGAKLEKGRAKTGGLAAGLDDLPLFAASIEAKEDLNPDPLWEALNGIDADTLTPREALDVIYRLKALAEQARDIT
jgi:DNA mismatch repair protein MutS